MKRPDRMTDVELAAALAEAVSDYCVMPVDEYRAKYRLRNEWGAYSQPMLPYATELLRRAARAVDYAGINEEER